MRELVSNYFRHVRRFVEALAQEYGVNNLVAGRKSGQIPDEGTISSGTHFKFHGIGCTIWDQTVWVDFDFLPDWTPAALDAPRLRRFLEENHLLDSLPSVEDIERSLANLASAGVIRRTERYRQYAPKDDALGSPS